MVFICCTCVISVVFAHFFSRGAMFFNGYTLVNLKQFDQALQVMNMVLTILYGLLFCRYIPIPKKSLINSLNRAYQ